MKIETNSAVTAQMATGRNTTIQANEKEKDTPKYDSVRVTKEFSWVDENGIPKNFLLGGNQKLPHGNEVEMERQIEDAYRDYYIGGCDEKFVRDTFEGIVESLRSNYLDLGFDEKMIMPGIIKSVYNKARMEVVYKADEASYMDSKRLIALYNGNDRNTKDYIYYDSDYYYKSEAMKDSLLECAKSLGQKYGFTNLKLQSDFDRSDERYHYSSYNTIVDDYAGYQWNIGNMIDDKMEPPKNFRFFYKSGESGTNIYPDTLTEVLGDGSDMFDGVLHVWLGDWSFTGRVPVRSNAISHPAINMYDVVRNSLPDNVAESGIRFLKNFDFFSPVQYDNYFRFRHMHFFS